MSEQPWLPATWDRQADVVVVGFGAAGAATAITAYDAGAQVILLDKAPEGQEGGNTRVAGQGYLNTSSVEKAITYPSMALKVPEFRSTFAMVALHFAKQPPGGMIVVGPNGKRFADEKYKTSAPGTSGNAWRSAASRGATPPRSSPGVDNVVLLISCGPADAGRCGGGVMTLQEAQALTNPFVRCRDGRIGQIVRVRAGYAPDDPVQDAVGVQVRGEQALRWIPVQHLKQGRDGLCQEAV